MEEKSYTYLMEILALLQHAFCTSDPFARYRNVLGSQYYTYLSVGYYGACSCMILGASYDKLRNVGASFVARLCNLSSKVWSLM